MGEMIICKGKLVPSTEAAIDLEDRGYQFGDGVYEVIRVYNGVMFTLDEHLDRLAGSLEKIKISLPCPLEELKGLLVQLVDINQIKTGTVYLQVTRGSAPRNHAFPGKNVEPVITAYTKEVPLPVETTDNGVSAIVVEDIRWLKCDIKSLNLLGSVLAKETAVENGCYEAIQHRGNLVTEGSSSNISIVFDGKVITHPANHLILNGIVRQVILKLCAKQGIPVEERPFAIEEMMGADEVFLSSTTSEITPIIKIEKETIGNGSPGKITKLLQSLYRNEIDLHCGK
ncbi:D-amino-acid transaminase [Bacillus testis]|uniref:D-amino-acid transaminase n=1 Tax=Bacillus testis TaxID=1622072 RepID=UPI00067F6A91|nr:D-amino-acid transaminase [Bacillus testis]